MRTIKREEKNFYKPILTSKTPFNAPEAISGAKSGLILLNIQSARFVKLGPRLARYKAFSLLNTGHLTNIDYKCLFPVNV